MSHRWHDIGGWRRNDGWDPATAKDDASLLNDDNGYDSYASKREWTYWRGSKREESDWDRRVALIPANDFLAAFLPVSPIPPTHLKRLQASSHFSRPKMKNAYSACCRALEATLKLAKSADVVKDISPEPIPEKVYRRFPDLALYPDSKIAHDAYDLPADVRVLDVPKDRARYRAHASWAHMVIPIEVCTDWGFYEAENRARMYHYAARVFSHQHRQHVFSLHFDGYQALIARWDRSGVVTSKFNLKTDSSVFYDFIHRFGRLTRAQQGYDPTVEFASPKDVAKLLQYTTTNEYLKLYHKKMSSDLEVWPIYKVSCDPLPDAGETDASRPSPSLRPRPKVFLIGKPLNYTERQEASPLGKSVRAYIAYDLADDRLVFLKDSWRDKEPFEDSEFGAYLQLRQHKIPHVPTPLAGGDVPNEPGSLIQSTQSDALIQSTRSGAYTSRKSRLLHHRLVLKEVCRPLWTYTCTPELIIAVYHALLAHRGCFETAGVLHRDISHNNIMIDATSNEPRGMLVDFDIHIAREDMDEDWAHYLTGSFPFHSLASLEDDFSNQSRARSKTEADDCESFIYVLIWMALRYQVHSLSLRYQATAHSDNEELAACNWRNTKLGMHITRLFSGSFRRDIQEKRDWIKQGRPPIRMRPGADGLPEPLAVLLRKLYLILQEHYMAREYTTKLDEDEKARRYRRKARAAEAAARAEAERKARLPKTRSVVEAERAEAEARRPFYFHVPDSWRARTVKYTPEQILQRKMDETRYEVRRVVIEAALRARLKKCRMVMDGYDAVLEAFRSVIFDENGAMKLARLEVSDKYPDQWLGLRSQVADHWGPSTAPARKRKAPDAVDEEQDAPALKRKAADDEEDAQEAKEEAEPVAVVAKKTGRRPAKRRRT